MEPKTSEKTSLRGPNPLDWLLGDQGLPPCWPCAVFTQAPDFSIFSASANFKELSGLDVAVAPPSGGQFWELVHESDVPQMRQQFACAESAHGPITSTFRIRHAASGRVAHILELRQPRNSPDGEHLGYAVMWLDVTRQTVAERRLAAANWKQTLAVLTLGLAHDFTNIIAGIHSLSETFLSSMAPDHPFHEGLSLIRKNSMQASQLIQRMVSLHLGQIGERHYVDLNEIAKDIVELVTKILPRRIRVTSELASGQLPVFLDPVEFRQVVINLMLNGADAMPQGGTLTLRTARHTEMPRLQCVKGIVPSGQVIGLTVADTGTGIKPRHLDWIFEPFFTTKPKGSGLGLYNARLAMEKQEGAISVESREGEGTRFNLWLAEADFTESGRADAETRRTSAERRSLLLIGPAGELLDKTAEWLRSHNYHVVIGASEDFGALLQSADYHFSGVYLLAVPGDSAFASLPAEIRQIRREMKIILQPAGCHQDDLDAHLLAGVDLVLNPELPQPDILRKLSTFFEQELT